MTPKPFLNDFWRDIVSVVSAVVTVVGFLVAYWQLRKTRSAALAAKDAAIRAVEESRGRFRKFILSNLFRFLTEARLHVNEKKWEMAAIRLGDVADQVSQLADVDHEWRPLLSEIRHWEETLRGRTSRGVRFAPRKWADLLTRLQSKIDRDHGPFKDKG